MEHHQFIAGSEMGKSMIPRPIFHSYVELPGVIMENARNRSEGNGWKQYWLVVWNMTFIFP